MSKHTFIIIDLECICQTSNLNEIIELGAIQIQENPLTHEIKIIKEFRSLIRPTFHKKLPRKIKQLTGINEEELFKAPCFEQVCADFQAWSGENPLYIGWGISDWYWMKENCKAYNLPCYWFTDHYLDFQKVYHRQTFGSQRPGSLIGLQAAIDLEQLPKTATKHRAYEDSLSCTRLFMKIFPQVRSVVLQGS